MNRALYKSHWVIASSFGTSLVLITKLETEARFEGNSPAGSKDVWEMENDSSAKQSNMERQCKSIYDGGRLLPSVQ